MKEKRFYVYALCYPDGVPFYIGKGTKSRVNEHERDAKKRVNGSKSEIIHEIWNSGNEVVKKILYTTNDEKAAFSYEISAIKTYSCLFDLCNIRKGGGGINGSKKDPKSTSVHVRWELPYDVWQIIKSHQRRLSAQKDQDATMEEALIDFIRTKKNLKP